LISFVFILLILCLCVDLQHVFFLKRTSKVASKVPAKIVEDLESFTIEILTGDDARNAWINRLTHLPSITLRLSLEPEGDTVLIYSHEGSVSGFAYIAIESSNAYIKLLWTNPKLRCDRFGTKIVAEIKQRFPGHCFLLWSLYTALPFWLKMDFATSDSELNDL